MAIAFVSMVTCGVFAFIQYEEGGALSLIGALYMLIYCGDITLCLLGNLVGVCILWSVMREGGCTLCQSTCFGQWRTHDHLSPSTMLSNYVKRSLIVNILILITCVAVPVYKSICWHALCSEVYYSQSCQSTCFGQWHTHDHLSPSSKGCPYW